jgi:pimeloyl-ACP methyl ester carboxylesterase
MVFVLLHSLLTGPAVWLRVAEELKRRSYDAIAPSLLGPGGAPRDWREAAGAAIAAVEASSDPVVLVGHSGGGLLLPVVADAVGSDVAGLVFVDSAVPASAGETPLVPAPLLDDLPHARGRRNAPAVVDLVRRRGHAQAGAR